MKLWIKTPFPYDSRGQGAWHECKTPYEKRLWKKHNKNNWLTTAQQAEKPEDD